MVNINKMHIREPASVLSKDVGKPLKFHLGSREATLFTKSTEYGKFIDNDYNDYLKEEENKRALRNRFSDYFNVTDNTSKGGGKGRGAEPQPSPPQPTINTSQAQSSGAVRAQSSGEIAQIGISTPMSTSMEAANIFGDSVNPPEDEQVQRDVAMENLNENIQAREAQTQQARASVAGQVQQDLRQATNTLFNDIYEKALNRIKSERNRDPEKYARLLHNAAVLNTFGYDATSSAANPIFFRIKDDKYQNSETYAAKRHNAVILNTFGYDATSSAANPIFFRPKPSDDIMNVAETAGDKAIEKDPESAHLKGLTDLEVEKANIGKELVTYFDEIMENPKIKVDAIKKQMIMRGVAFKVKDTKAQLISAIKKAIEGKKWTVQPDPNTIKNNIDTYRQTHKGKVPLEVDPEYEVPRSKSRSKLIPPTSSSSKTKERSRSRPKKSEGASSSSK